MIMSLKETSLENRIVPAVHDPVAAAEEFQLYADSGAQVIAIGSYPPLAADQWGKINWLRIKYGVGIHLFGNVRNEVIRRYLPESVDTAQYAITAKFGGMLYWNEHRHELESINILDPQEFLAEHKDFIKSTFGFTPLDLLQDVVKKWIVGLDAICRMKAYLTDEWYPNNDVADLEIGD